MNQNRSGIYAFLVFFVAACGGVSSGGNEPPGAGTGGAGQSGGTGTGGTTGRGGSANSGGSTNAGGSGNTGGSGNVGGSVNTGGAGNTGGTGNTGGAGNTGGSTNVGGAGNVGGASGAGGVDGGRAGAGGAGGASGAAGAAGAGTGGAAGAGGAAGGTVDAGPVEMATGIEAPQVTINYTCTPQTWDSVAVGWATNGGLTGGGNAAPVTVTSLANFNTQAAGTAARVIMVSGRFSGTATIGSNKTILGMCGAEIDGHIQMSGSTNVIIRNLKVVGLNCTDNADCQSGADAISVEAQSNHIWFDHIDVSNGSDGNLDITQVSDFVTVSWAKFSYTGRAGGHQFSNLVGADDGDTDDTGHLRTTWHHNWWSTGVQDRMPRVRFGQVQVSNNLYIAPGNDACIGVGVNANILAENNIFMSVQDPIEVTHSNAASVIASRGNVFQSVSGGFIGIGTGVFTPPYTYRTETTNGLAALIMAKAGVK